MVELDQFKYTLSTYEKPLQEVRVALNLDAKMKKIDELDRTMEEPSFWEDADRAAKMVKEAKNLKDTAATGGCGECQASCQTASKVDNTVNNQKCECKSK